MSHLTYPIPACLAKEFRIKRIEDTRGALFDLCYSMWETGRFLLEPFETTDGQIKLDKRITVIGVTDLDNNPSIMVKVD